MFEEQIEDLKARIRTFQLPPELRQKFEGFLSKMGASTRKTVAVSFSQNLGLEMIEVDNIAGRITKYATKPLNYDAINRRMESYTEFAKGLNELFEEFDISSSSNVILSLPNLLFGLMDVPKILHGDTVKNVILSEVEQSYIFKSNEPIVSWHNLSRGKKKRKDKPNNILYTAIQKDVIENILEACQVVGCRFLTIETSHLSTLRGLAFLGLIADQVKEDSVWQLLIVDANVFSIITMQGQIPIKYYEEPLALKSFEEDEIYKAIASSANEVLNNEKIKYKDVLILSQTDFINAEALKAELDVGSHPVDILNSNKYSQMALYPVGYDVPEDMAEQISLTSIGAAAFLFYNYPIYLNYIKETVEERENIDDQIGNIKINLGNIELNITRNTIRRLSVIFAAIMLVPLFLIYIIIGQLFLPNEQSKAENLAASIESINRQIKELTESGQQTHFDINTAAKKSVEKNKDLLFKYSLLGEVIPKDIWINHTEDYTDHFFVSGVSVSIQKIYEFYKNLKTVSNNQSLTLNKLEVSNESLESYITSFGKIPRTLYKFEIASGKDIEQSENVKHSFNITALDPKALSEEPVTNNKVTVSGEPPAKASAEPEQNSPPPAEGAPAPTEKIQESKLPANLKKIVDIGD